MDWPRDHCGDGCGDLVAARAVEDDLEEQITLGGPSAAVVARMAT